MIHDILLVIWVFLPAGIANSSPVIAAHIPLLNKLGHPIDRGLHFRGKRLLGQNKTVRGYAVGVAGAAITIAFQVYLYNHNQSVRDFVTNASYDHSYIVLLGALMGFGALLGDSIESFFKRQLSIQSGQKWFPYDQIDYVLGAIVFSTPFVHFSAGLYVLTITVWVVIHLVASYIGWVLGFKEAPI
jgi:CDP-2,3-bis-(O-geranylgeranyl)-sn-glycerol synthase